MSRNQKSIDPAIFVVITIFLLLGGVLAVILISVQQDELSARLDENPQLPLAVFISDEEGLISIQLVLLDAGTGNFSVYDVPRKLGAIIPALGRVDRMDNLHAELGADALARTLGGILSLDIGHYLDINLDDLEAMVDLIEGMSVFLPLPIEDEIDGKLLRIPGGNVHLDGEKIASYVAYEGGDERELEFISRRWTFVREFFRSMGDYPLLLENEQVFERFYRHMRSNFDRESAKTLIGMLSGLNYDRMITQRVLGNERVVETSQGAQTILFPHFEGQLVRDSIRQVLRSLAESESSLTEALNSRIEVLNGTSINGLASRTRDLYQNFGYQVVRVANADRNDYEQTLVIDRTGNPANAARVASVINVDQVEPGQPLVENPEVDITIILGRDFDGFAVTGGE